MSADPTLVVAATRGDKQAFGRLVTEHMNLVTSITTSIAASIGVGEELAQEVFLEAWVKLPSLRDPAAFTSWVRTMARNRGRDWQRRRAVRRTDALEPGALDRLAAPDVEDPRDAAARDRALQEGLDGLTDEDRELLVLFYREGSSVRAVAEQLGIREDACRKRLSRARERLRDRAEERLAERLRRTAPGAAFAVGVVSLLPNRAMAQPAPTARILALSGVLGLALLGAGGLATCLPEGPVAAPPPPPGPVFEPASLGWEVPKDPPEIELAGLSNDEQKWWMVTAVSAGGGAEVQKNQWAWPDRAYRPDLLADLDVEWPTGPAAEELLTSMESEGAKPTAFWEACLEEDIWPDAELASDPGAALLALSMATAVPPGEDPPEDLYRHAAELAYELAGVNPEGPIHDAAVRHLLQRRVFDPKDDRHQDLFDHEIGSTTSPAVTDALLGLIRRDAVTWTAPIPEHTWTLFEQHTLANSQNWYHWSLAMEQALIRKDHDAASEARAVLDAVRDQACVDPQGPYPTQCDIYTEAVRSVDGLAAYRFGGAKPDDWRRAVHWSLWHCAELHGLPDEVTVSERTAGGMWRAWNPGPDAWTSCVEAETRGVVPADWTLVVNGGVGSQTARYTWPSVLR